MSAEERGHGCPSSERWDNGQVGEEGIQLPTKGRAPHLASASNGKAVPL